MTAVETQLQRIRDLSLERRHVVRHTAVTRPDVDCPWVVSRLKHVVKRIIDTPHATAPVVEGGQYLVAGTAAIRDGRLVVGEDAHWTDHETYKAWTRRAVVAPGDILLTREAPAGEACIVPDTPTLCLGQRTVQLQIDQDCVDSRFVLHSLYAGPAQEFIRLLSRSTTVAHLNMRDIGDIPIDLPPLTAQRHSMDALEAELEDLDRTIRQIGQQMLLLAERRQVLINEAATGKLDVSGVAM
jgi:type I restriction enzyme S subunit